MKTLLAIDTSTERATVALLSDGVITTKVQNAQKQHAHFLLPMIDELLLSAGVELSALDGIVFGCGPGSFTGLRITCSIVKGLAYAHNTPLFPASSLAAIANEVKHQLATSPAILTMIDARMNQVYWSCYYSNGESTEALVSSVPDIVLAVDGPVILAGVGYTAYRSQLPEAVNLQIVSDMEIYPEATAMIRLALSGQLQSVSIDEALPVYIRNQIVQGASHG